MKRLILLLAFVVAAPAQDPLTLDEVLSSVDRAYPLLASAVQEHALAEADLLEAQGGFDLKIKSGYDTNQFGFYKNRTLGAGVSQPTQLWGAEFYGGYKRGQGNYGPWEQDLLSLDQGEWAGGVSVPLWRDRAIDRRRADLAIAGLGLNVADQSIDKQRLTFLKLAAKAYWYWVASGRQLEVAQNVLALALTRNEALEETVEAGLVAPIELTDNQRAILQRRAAVVAAERALQNAGIELSLFYRDPQGEPVIPGDDRLPDFPEPQLLDALQVQTDLLRAVQRRPEALGIVAKRAQTDVERELADNQLAPAVNLIAEYSRDFGQGSITKTGSELKAGIAFETPFQRRKAKAKLAMQNAKLMQLTAELQFAQEQIRAEVRDAASALLTAYERVDFLRQELEVARQLEQLERERFELGDSTLFLVNLRETATATAASGVVKALADYHLAQAAYRGATADLLGPNP